MNIETIYSEARSHAERGALPKAIELYSSILQASPTHYEALRDMAFLQLRSPKSGQSNPFIEALIRHHPDKAESYYLEGARHLGANDAAAAQEALQKAIVIDPQHKGAYNALLKQALLLGKQTISPVFLNTPPPYLNRLQIEITTWCNLHCAGCPRTIDIRDGKWNNVHMPLERFAQILAHMPPSHTLCLQGVGESTLHPDFPEMVRMAKASGKYTYININSNTLAKPITYYEKLKEGGLNSLSVSVDSFTPDIAEACRSGTNVEKLKKRVAELMMLYSPETFMVTMVVSKRNLADLPDTLAILNAMGKLMIEIQTLIVYDADKGNEGSLPYGLTQGDQSELARFLTEQKDYPNLTFSGTLLARAGSPYRCTRPFTSPFVMVEGYLTPCCTIYDPALLGHANIAQKPLKELWIQPKFQEWLVPYAHHSQPICKDCCFYTG